MILHTKVLYIFVKYRHMKTLMGKLEKNIAFSKRAMFPENCCGICQAVLGEDCPPPSL